MEKLLRGSPRLSQKEEGGTPLSLDSFPLPALGGLLFSPLGGFPGRAVPGTSDR